MIQSATLKSEWLPWNHCGFSYPSVPSEEYWCRQKIKDTDDEVLPRHHWAPMGLHPIFCPAFSP
jgi:hypothetical protein